MGPVVLWAALLCNHNCISMKRGKEMKRETDSCGGFFFFNRKKKACLVKHIMRVSIHITTHCRSTHLQHVVAPQMGISQLLYLKVTFNICYSTRLGWRGMLISLVSRAELWLLVAALQVFILAFVRQHMGRGWNSGLWSLFKSISYLFIYLCVCVAFPEWDF